MADKPVIHQVSSKSLPNSDLCHWRYSGRSRVASLLGMRKQHSMDNANLTKSSVEIHNNETCPNYNSLHQSSGNANLNANLTHLISPNVTIPVSIEVKKPMFDISPNAWENFWDDHDDLSMTDSTSDSTPASPISYTDSISRILEEEESPMSCLSTETPRSSDSITTESTISDSITSPTKSINIESNEMSSESILLLPLENMNNENNNANLNNLNDNAHGNHMNGVKTGPILTYKSSSDSLSSYLSDCSTSSSIFAPSLSSCSLVSFSGSDSPRRRVKDSEGYIRRAACVCVNESETQVMLASSKKCEDVWLVPGGGLELGEEPEEAALREAWEEAGVKGRVSRYLGVFETQHEGSSKKHRTAVYVIIVSSILNDFPEAHIGRQRRWFSVEEAVVQLNKHKPLQSAYLQFLRVSKQNSSKSSKSSDEGSTTD